MLGAALPHEKSGPQGAYADSMACNISNGRQGQAKESSNHEEAQFLTKPVSTCGSDRL